MISSTSNSKKSFGYIKALQALAIAALIIAIVELSISYLLKDKQMMRNINKDNVLDANFLKDDVEQKYILGYKYYNFSESDADIITIGDSSGLRNVRPLIVNKYFAGRHKLINGSCCGDASWKGDIASANFYLRNNKQIKYLIYYITPYSSPKAVAKKATGLGDQLLQLNSMPWLYFYQFPSLYFRKSLVRKIYREPDIGEKEKILNTLAGINTLGKSNNYNEAMRIELGWVPTIIPTPSFKQEIFTKECGRDMIEYLYDKQLRKSYFEGYLDKMKKLADSYNVKLMIIFAPVACTNSWTISPILDEINDFKKRNPDVIFLYDFINTRAAKDFSDNYHLMPEASAAYSEEFGGKLEKFLDGN